LACFDWLRQCLSSLVFPCENLFFFYSLCADSIHKRYFQVWVFIWVIIKFSNIVKKVCLSHFAVYLTMRKEIKKAMSSINRSPTKKEHILLFLIFNDKRQQTNGVMELLHRRRLDCGWIFISLSLSFLNITFFRLLSSRQDGAGMLCICASLSHTLFFFLYLT
jgi:hypothetical protein